MTAAKTIGEIDLLTEADLTELARHGGGPHVSLFMPTHRAGPDTRQDPIRFKNLLTRAAALLTDQHGLSDRDADALLAPARDLDAGDEFWQYQADGLAVFLAPGTVRSVRVPLEVAEDVTVGPRFRLRPLLPLLAGDGHFLVLALSQNHVRLYEGTRFTIAELDLGPIPGSMAEALAHEDPESQLQLRTGGAAGMYHGHGEGDEIDKQRLERYLRAVDRGLVERVGAGGRTPLVLAAVGYYLPLYAEVTALPELADRAVEGNPENRSAEDLHAAAWDIVAPRFEAARRTAAEAWRAASATGTTSTDVATIVPAALEGRIDTLFLAGDAPVWGRLDGAAPPSVDVHDAPQPGDDDLLDLAAVETILTGGTVYTAEPDVSDDADTPGVPGDGSPAAARLRW